MAELALNVNVDVKGQDRLRNLGSTLAGGAVQFAKFAAVGTAAVGAFGAFTANFASDMNESLSKVGVVFGKNADDIEKWSQDAASAMGISQQAALESAGTFGNLFTAMGLADKPTAEMSKNLVGLASDLASFNNIGTDEALEKLRAGLVGEAEPLRTLGVQLSAARVEAFLMQKGVKKVNGEFTDAQKVQARYALILQDTEKAQGDFNRTSDGMANQQRILQATFQDSMAKIGQAFVPIFQELIPIATQAIKGFADFIVQNMPTIKSIFSTVFSAIGTAIGFVVDQVLPRVGQAFTWIAQNVFPLFQQAASGTGGVFATIGGIINTFATSILPALISAFQAVVGWVSDNWPTISSVIGQALGAVGNAVKVVWPIVERIATVLFPLVGAAASVLFKALDVAFKLIGGVFEVAGEVASTMVEGITGAWETLKTVTTEVWNSITGIIKGVLNGVIDVINGFIGFLNGFQIGIPAIDVGPVHIGGGVIDPFNIGLIPHLAEGGIVTSPTLALLGEGGPEAVVPLTNRPLGTIQRIFNLDIQAPLRANDAQDIAEYIDRIERLEAAMDWEAGQA